MGSYLNERRKYNIKKYPESLIKLPFIGYFNHNRYCNPLFDNFRKQTFIYSDYVKSNPFVGYLNHSVKINRNYLDSNNYVNKILIPDIFDKYNKKKLSIDIDLPARYIDINNLDQIELDSLPNSTKTSLSNRSFNNLYNSDDSINSCKSCNSVDFEIIDSNVDELNEYESWINYFKSYLKKN